MNRFRKMGGQLWARVGALFAATSTRILALVGFVVGALAGMLVFGVNAYVVFLVGALAVVVAGMVRSLFMREPSWPSRVRERGSNVIPFSRGAFARRRR